MKRLLFILAFIPFIAHGQWSPQTLGAKNVIVTNPGIFKTDSISNTWGQYDSTVSKAAFPGIRLKGRTGWQGNTPFVLDSSGNAYMIPSIAMLSNYVTASRLSDSAASIRASIPDVSIYALKTTTVNGHPISGNVTVTKSDVGLGNVDNTSDANKPISTATQTALNLKLSIVDTPFMLSPYLKKGDSTLYVTQSQALNLVSYGNLTSTLAAYLLKADTPAMLAAYLPRRDSSIYSGYTTHYQVDSAVYKRFIASIEDFGADPTGVLNSNLPIRQAIGTSKAIVLIPIGTYLMDDTAASPAYPQTTMKVGQTIIGLSRTASIIKTTVNTAMIGINVGCSGHDFTLRGSGVGKNDTGKRLQTGLVGVARSNVDFHDIILKCFSGGHDVNATGANNGGGLVLTNGDAVTRHRGVFYSIWADSCNVGVSVDNRSEYYSFTNTDITNSRIGIWLGAGNIDWTGGGINANLYSFFINDKANSGNNGHCNFNGVKFNHNDTSVIDSTLIGMSFNNCTFYNGLTVGSSYFKIKNSVGIHFSGGDMSQQVFTLTNNKKLSMTGVFEFIPNVYNVISGERFSVINASNSCINASTDTFKVSNILTSQNSYSISAIPTVVAGTGAGTTPTVAIETGSTNSRMKVSLTLGTTPAASATIATITFSGSFAYPTNCKPVASPGNEAAATLSGASQVYCDGSAGSFTLKSNTVPLTGGPYIWYITTGN